MTKFGFWTHLTVCKTPRAAHTAKNTGEYEYEFSVALCLGDFYLLNDAVVCYEIEGEQAGGEEQEEKIFVAAHLCCRAAVNGA